MENQNPFRMKLKHDTFIVLAVPGVGSRTTVFLMQVVDQLPATWKNLNRATNFDVVISTVPRGYEQCRSRILQEVPMLSAPHNSRHKHRASIISRPEDREMGTSIGFHRRQCYARVIV